MANPLKYGPRGFGGFQKLGPFSRSPHNRDHVMFGHILELHIYEIRHHLFSSLMTSLNVAPCSTALQTGRPSLQP